MIIVTILAISEGWNCINPRGSQRFDPFTVIPNSNTALKDKMVSITKSKE